MKPSRSDGRCPRPARCSRRAGRGRRHPLIVTEIDLDSEEGRRLGTEAGVLFAPGILLDGRPFAYGRLSERRLRRTLAAAPNPA
jgi:hypothetical protein